MDHHGDHTRERGVPKRQKLSHQPGRLGVGCERVATSRLRGRRQRAPVPDYEPEQHVFRCHSRSPELYPPLGRAVRKEKHRHRWDRLLAVRHRTGHQETHPRTSQRLRHMPQPYPLPSIGPAQQVNELKAILAPMDSPIAPDRCGCPISREATVLTMAPGVEQPGRVIILNGGSSAGKTTLGRALQSAMPGPWLLLGIDLLIWTLPPEMINDPDGLSIHEGVITRGQLFTPLYEGFQYAVSALGRSGVDVLIDDLTLDGLVDQQRWNNALEGLDVCWVAVRCAPQIAAEREARRGTRLPGIARHQADSVHAGVHYDVEVDTGVLDLNEELSVIAEALWQRWSLMIATESSPKANAPSHVSVDARRSNPAGSLGTLTSVCRASA